MLKNDQWIFQCYNYQPPPGKHVLVFLWNCIILFVLILWFFGTISVNCVERKTYFDRPLVISGQQMKHPCCLWCLGLLLTIFVALRLNRETRWNLRSRIWHLKNSPPVAPCGKCRLARFIQTLQSYDKYCKSTSW